MSRDAILNKWLFLAYSAKREGDEDRDYRAKLKTRGRVFAGDKGVGRFSCDRLGKQLVLASRAAGQPVQLVRIDWTKYEAKATQEFRKVLVSIEDAASFPPSFLDLAAQPVRSWRLPTCAMTGLARTCLDCVKDSRSLLIRSATRIRHST